MLNCNLCIGPHSINWLSEHVVYGLGTVCGIDLTECLHYVDAHDALYDITWPRIMYAENGA